MKVNLMQTGRNFGENQVFVRWFTGKCKTVQRIDKNIFHCIFKSRIAFLIKLIHFVQRPQQYFGFAFFYKIPDLSGKDIDDHKRIFCLVNFFEFCFGFRNHFYDFQDGFCMIHYFDFES